MKRRKRNRLSFEIDAVNFTIETSSSIATGVPGLEIDCNELKHGDKDSVLC